MRRFLVMIASIAVFAGCAPEAADPPDGPDVEPDTMLVWVTFTRNELPVTVRREVPRPAGEPLGATDRLRAALEALLAGPTPIERDAGITSWFSAETAEMLAAVSVDPDGRAIVDFQDFRAIIPNASTSFGSTMLLTELDATVFAVEGVETVEFRIDRSCDTFWNFLQRSCEIVERETTGF